MLGDPKRVFRQVEIAASICSLAPMSDPVAALISRLSPAPVCDACIAERLNLGKSQIANLKVRRVAGADGFERRRDICSLCFAERLVTRRA